MIPEWVDTVQPFKLSNVELYLWGCFLELFVLGRGTGGIKLFPTYGWDQIVFIWVLGTLPRCALSSSDEELSQNLWAQE